MQLHRLAAADVPPHDRLGAIVDDLARHAAEVGKGLGVAGPEGGQVLAGGVAAEGVTRVGEDHVEAVDGRAVGEALLVAPIDLGLGAERGLEAAVHLAAAPQAELGTDLRAP